MDRGAWWATDPGVAKSLTQLSTHTHLADWPQNQFSVPDLSPWASWHHLITLVLDLGQLPCFIPRSAPSFPLSPHDAYSPRSQETLPAVCSLKCTKIQTLCLRNHAVTAAIISPPARERRDRCQCPPSGFTHTHTHTHTHSSQVFIPFRKQRCEFKYYCQGNTLLRKTSNQNHKLFKS